MHASAFSAQAREEGRAVQVGGLRQSLATLDLPPVLLAQRKTPRASVHAYRQSYTLTCDLDCGGAHPPAVRAQRVHGAL